MKNLLSDTGSIPGRGTKIPHAEGQLSLRATTRAFMPQLRSKAAKKKKKKWYVMGTKVNIQSLYIKNKSRNKGIQIHTICYMIFKKATFIAVRKGSNVLVFDPHTLYL